MNSDFLTKFDCILYSTVYTLISCDVHVHTRISRILAISNVIFVGGHVLPLHK